MRNFTRVIIGILFISQISINNSFSQCSNFVGQYPAGTQTTTVGTLTTVSTCIFGGEYSAYNVTAGQTYTWTTCGNTAFDTQLTLWNTAHTISYGYNDDNCGLQSTITWTATFTGVVHVLVSQYSCLSNSTCMTVQWACTSCSGGGVITAGDCSNAVNICTNAAFQVDPNGFGSVNEFTTGSISNPSIKLLI